MICYTYLVGWSKLDVWYYGCRYAKNCSPQELWIKYFTSSKLVKNFRKIHGEPDVIQIRKTFDSELSARTWEYKVLKRMKVKNSSRWLNQTDNIFPFYSKDRSYQKTEKWSKMMSAINKGRSPWHKGKKNEKTRGTKFYNNGIEQRMFAPNTQPDGWLLGRLNKPWNTGKPHSDKVKQKISNSLKGKKGSSHSEETKQKISNSRKGKKIGPMTKENKQKRSVSMKGKKFYNNGIENKRFIQGTQPEGWVPKRLNKIIN